MLADQGWNTYSTTIETRQEMVENKLVPSAGGDESAFPVRVAKALYLLARSYLDLGDMQGARTALQDLLEYHSGSDYARKAEKLIESRDLELKSG